MSEFWKHFYTVREDLVKVNGQVLQSALDGDTRTMENLLNAFIRRALAFKGLLETSELHQETKPVEEEAK